MTTRTTPDDTQDGRSARGLGAGVLGVDAAAFVVIVIAATHVGTEYSTGLIHMTLTLTPSRWRTLAGKLVTVGLAGVAVGIFAAVVCILAAVIAGATAGADVGSTLTGTGLPKPPGGNTSLASRSV
ncbi:hypothetical protein ACQEVF_43725 [Nonomuraea polychroma]|uniref:hypothetical protein n=1 Tax=Nonomuraea polychroma TaxID=46176 RepID=UPI003D8A7ECD